MMSNLKLKVAVSTGLFMIAHPEELATVVRKVGYGLTRGTGAIEIGGDVPHEVDYSEGHEIRYIAKKQGVDINMHGSLTVPFEIPEMVQWQEADDHVHKSLKSAVYAGSKYIDFHASLHFWLEMMSYAGSRLEIIMADWVGRFISEIFYESALLRKYFIEDEQLWEKYSDRILGEERNVIWYTAQHEASLETREKDGKAYASLQRTKYEEGVKAALGKKFTEKTKEKENGIGLVDFMVIM